MRRELPISQEFHEKANAARESVQKNIDAFESRTMTYLNQSEPAIEREVPSSRKRLTESDKEILRDFQRNCIGAMSILVSGAIDSTISSTYIMPEDQWELINQICEKWQTSIVPKIQGHKMFRGEVYVPSQAKATSLRAMMQTTAQGIVSVFAIKYLEYIKDYIKKHDMAQVSKDDRKVLVGCLQLYLKIIYQSERLVKDAEMVRFPFTCRQRIWRSLRQLDPTNKTLVWFEENGEVSPYPQWWEKNAALSDRWSRYVEFDYGNDFQAFYISGDEKLVRDLAAIQALETLSSLDAFDYLHLMRCLKANLEKFIREVETESQTDIDWILALRQLSRRSVNEFYSVFHDDNDYYRDEDQQLMVERLKKDLTVLGSLITKEGKLAWPDEYYTARVSIADIWKNNFSILGFETYEDFITSNLRLVTHHLTWPAFEEKWEQQYIGEELESSVQACIKKDLDACKDAILHRLYRCDDLSDQEREDYRCILETYAAKFKNRELIRLLESTTRQLRVTLHSTIWKQGLCQFVHKIQFYRKDCIASFITEENYQYYDHKMKAMMAEGAVELLESSARELITIDSEARGRLYRVMTLFLHTQFSQAVVAGVAIAPLKEIIRDRLDASVAETLPRFDVWLAQAKQRISRLHGGSMITFSLDNWVNPKLSVAGYQSLSLSGRRLLLQVIQHRLRMYLDDVNAQYTSVRYMGDDRQLWLKIAFMYMRDSRFLSEEDDVLCAKLRTLILKLNNLGEHIRQQRQSARVSHLSMQISTYGERITNWMCSEKFLQTVIAYHDQFKQIPLSQIQSHVKRVCLSVNDSELVLLRDDAMMSDELYQALVDKMGLDRELVDGWYIEAMQEHVMLQGLMIDDISTHFLNESTLAQFVAMSRHMSASHLSQSSFYVAYWLFLLVDPAIKVASDMTILALAIFHQFINQQFVECLRAVAFEYPGFQAYFELIGKEKIRGRLDEMLGSLHHQLEPSHMPQESYQSAALDYGIDYKALRLEAALAAVYQTCGNSTKRASYQSSLLSLMGFLEAPLTNDKKKEKIDAQWGRLQRGDWSGALFNKQEAAASCGRQPQMNGVNYSVA